MSHKLVIDLGKCKEQDLLGVRCSYKHHPENNGMRALLERLRFVLICRKCTVASCVKACPRSALEKISSENGDDGVLKRYTMRCTGCGTCAMACPFGTIYPELIPFTGDICDVCRDRLEDDEKPLCVQTCTDNAIDYKKSVTIKDDLVEVFDDIVAKVPEGALWEPFLRSAERKK